MLYNDVTWADHYLDDFIMAGAPGFAVCQHNLQIMLRTCEELGLSINPDKLVHPTSLEFLGIVLDMEKMEMRISEQRLQEVLAKLVQWYQRTTATKREILSLVGKLIFFSRVVRAGQSFV